MKLSVRAESIILSAPLAESMILSQCRPRASMPCETAHERALMLKASYSQQAALRFVVGRSYSVQYKGIFGALDKGQMLYV